MTRLLLIPKYRLYEEHQERLLRSPDPEAARLAFDARLRDARRVSKFRFVCLVGLYFSIVAALTSILLGALGLERVGDVVGTLAGILSGLTAIFIGGIFVCNQYLARIDVVLTFLSQEARLESPGPDRLT